VDLGFIVGVLSGNCDLGKVGFRKTVIPEKSDDRELFSEDFT